MCALSRRVVFLPTNSAQVTVILWLTLKRSNGNQFFSKKRLTVVGHETYLSVKRNHCTFYMCIVHA